MKNNVVGLNKYEKSAMQFQIKIETEDNNVFFVEYFVVAKIDGKKYELGYYHVRNGKTGEIVWRLNNVEDESMILSIIIQIQNGWRGISKNLNKKDYREFFVGCVENAKSPRSAIDWDAKEGPIDLFGGHIENIPNCRCKTCKSS